MAKLTNRAHLVPRPSPLKSAQRSPKRFSSARNTPAGTSTVIARLRRVLEPEIDACLREFHLIFRDLTIPEDIAKVVRSLPPPWHAFLRAAIYSTNDTIPPEMAERDERPKGRDNMLDVDMRWFDGDLVARGACAWRDCADVVVLFGLFGPEFISRTFTQKLRKVASKYTHFASALAKLHLHKANFKRGRGVAKTKQWPIAILDAALEEPAEEHRATKGLNKVALQNAGSRGFEEGDSEVEQDATHSTIARQDGGDGEESAEGILDDGSSCYDDSEDAAAGGCEGDESHEIEYGRNAPHAREEIGSSFATVTQLNDTTITEQDSDSTAFQPIFRGPRQAALRSMWTETPTRGQDCHQEGSGEGTARQQSGEGESRAVGPTTPRNADSNDEQGGVYLADNTAQLPKARETMPDMSLRRDPYNTRHAAVRDQLEGRSIIAVQTMVQTLTTLNPNRDEITIADRLTTGLDCYKLIVLLLPLDDHVKLTVAFIKPGESHLDYLDPWADTFESSPTTTYSWFLELCAGRFPQSKPYLAWSANTVQLPPVRCLIDDGNPEHGSRLRILIRCLYYMHKRPFPGQFDASPWQRILVGLYWGPDEPTSRRTSIARPEMSVEREQQLKDIRAMIRTCIVSATNQNSEKEESDQQVGTKAFDVSGTYSLQGMLVHAALEEATHPL